MPAYFYKAKTVGGETKNGIQEAKDKHELAKALHQQGIVLISATLQASTKKAGGARSFMSFGRFFGVPLVEKMMFTRHLSVMVDAGLSLNRALAVLAEQSANQKFKGIITRIGEEVSKGSTFADSLANSPKEFNELYVNMVRVGEESGKLVDVLQVLARQMQKEHDLKSRVRGAMLYPAIVVSAMSGIGTLMMILVIPRLAEVFEELEAELPPTTQAVIFLGTFLANNVLLVIISVPVGIFLVKKFLDTKTGKYLMDWLLLRFPIFSGITRKVNVARFSRTLSSLIESGVPIVRALEITAGTLTNHYYRDSVLASSKQVKKGTDLHSGIGAYPSLYPPIVVQMIAVGEETGSLSDIMRRLAVFYEGEVNTITKSLATVIEPILMLVIGGAVGFFAVSMIQPMYSMMNNI